MDTLIEWSLQNLAVYGAPTLLFLTFIGSLGIPFPVTMVVIAAGALARAGMLDWRLAFVAAVAGAMLADHSEYLAGRLAQPGLRRRFGETALWRRAQTIFERQGAWAILLTRFWLMPLAPAINMMAGGRYPVGRFFFYDLLGQSLWVLLYGGLGYFFAAQWEWISQAASVFTWGSLAVAAVALGVYALIRRHRFGGGDGQRVIVSRATRARLIRPLTLRATAAAVRRLRPASRLPRQRVAARRALIGTRQTDDAGGLC
ncbi:MAG TPA: DedA family protein [Anaerolineales bacterium]|nr:DedA family protein [Anaerolineales bacterium]